MNNANDQNLLNLNQLIQESKNSIFIQANEIQKMLGKTTINDLIVKKKELILNAVEFEPFLIEILEFTRNYRSLIEEIDGFGIKISSKTKVIDLLKTEINNLESFQLYFKNLIKSINGLFIKKTKTIKKGESDYISHLKAFNRIYRNLERDFETQNQLFNAIIVELSKEIELIKKTEPIN